MSTNTTSINDTNNNTPPVIQAEENYKTEIQEQNDKEDKLADKIKNMIREQREQAKTFANYTRNYFLDEEHSKNIHYFLNTALITAIVLVIYGLYGSMMSYLFLALQQSNGLGGLEMNGPPFISKKVFNKCSDKSKVEDFGTMLQRSLIEYSFPYKNPIACDKFNAIKEPFLYIRFTRWVTTMIAYSYSSGRQFLNMYFGLFNSKTAFWIMPIANLIILAISPIFGILSHGFGGVINAPELLPQLPFGAISLNPFSMFVMFIVYIISIFILPLIFGIVQTLVLTFFLGIYPLFQKEAFSFPEAQNTFMSGWTFITRYFQGKFKSLLLVWLFALTYNAYVNLEPFMAFFIIGLVALHFFIMYFKNFAHIGSLVFQMLFKKNNTILISLGFVALIMLILTMI